MVAQRRDLQLHLINDTVDEQNRILRQINDFLLILSKALCEHGGHQVRHSLVTISVYLSAIASSLRNPRLISTNAFDTCSISSRTL